jgi:8-oxo-dGTP pyrophosphatase MutT (NUDIX family)
MSHDFPHLAAAFDDYRTRHPEEAGIVVRFADFLASDAAVFERGHAPGHFTGSAWLISADGGRVLLMHHRKLGRWLQPGGHADGDADLARVALREAREETGVEGLRVEGGIFDLDRHRIAAHVPVVSPDGPTASSGFAPGESRPARGAEPEHWHYDVRYVVRATAGEAFAANEESLGLAWRPVREVAADPGVDESVRRMARKWLERL